MSNMRNWVVWAIRDDETLTHAEKSILWAVESRGTASRTWQGMCKDTGMSKGTFYKHRKVLMEKGLLSVTERPGTTTEYRVLPEGFHTLCEPSTQVSEAAEGFTPVVKGGSQPLVTEEEHQEDHLPTTKEDYVIAPCFDCGEVSCVCATETTAPEVEAVEKKPCGCAPGTSCPTCRGDVPRIERHPEFKRKGWYDDHLADEGLNEFGEPLGLDY